MRISHILRAAKTFSELQAHKAKVIASRFETAVQEVCILYIFDLLIDMARQSYFLLEWIQIPIRFGFSSIKCIFEK